MPLEKIQVVKLPPKESKEATQKPKFPKMPRLYLELFENKNKIKPELVNKEYISKDTDSTEEKSTTGTPVPPEIVSSATTMESNHRSNSDNKHSRHSDRDEYSDRGKNNSRHSDRDEYSDRGKNNSRHSEYEMDDDLEIFLNDKHSDGSRSENDDKYENKSTQSLPSTPRTPMSISPDRSMHESKISDRLRELMDDDDDNDVVMESSGTQPRQSSIRIPPSLAELEKSGQITRKKEAMDVSSMSEQDAEDAKREYLFKFELLKKSYKQTTIPEFTIHSDFQTIKRTYESTLRMLSLDRSVEEYKQYMSMAFSGIEVGMGQFFNFDMAGFAAHQQLKMSSYDHLLVELGEKSYVPTGSKYPVELRLLFVVVINTAVFMFTKIILKKTGVNITPTAPSEQNQQPAQKRKMKGPVVNIDDIPDV